MNLTKGQNMYIDELPERIQTAIQQALDQCDEDYFAETVERGSNSLVVGVSLPGSDEIAGQAHLIFNQEQETFTVYSIEKGLK